MTGIHEEAERLAAERLHAYDKVLADLYFMAARASDYETQEEIWNEAWASGNLHLLGLLLLSETSLFELL